MTKKMILILLIPFLYFSCSKTEDPAAIADSAAVVKANKEVVSETFNSVHRGMTYNIGDEDSDDPKLDNSTIRLDLGDKFFSLGKIVSVKDKKNTMLELVKCKTQKDEIFWLRADIVVPGGTLAIVKDDETNIYREPDKLKPTGEILSKMTIVTTYPDSESGFRKVTTWDEKLNKKRANIYIKAEDLSKRESDIQSIRTYFLATKLNNDVAKKTLFKTALEYKDSIFYDFIENEYNKIFESPETQTPNEETVSVDVPEFEEIDFAATINDNDVNVRTLPILESSEIITQLNIGDSVSITGQTTDSFSVGGISAKWYKISEPEGWVFGSYLDPQ